MKSRIVSAGQVQSQKAYLAVAAALLAMLLMLIACTSTTDPARVITIVPASETVAIQSGPYGRELSVNMTLTNTSSMAIYYWGCGVRLERRIDGPIAVNAAPIWQTVWSPICTAEAKLPPPTLQPGESVTIPITALVITDPNSFPKFDGAAGVYRAQFALATGILGSSRQLSEEESSSVPFTVVVN